MNDTPQDIKNLQLKIWLSKSPAERLKQFMEDNTALFQFWDTMQKPVKKRASNYQTAILMLMICNQVEQVVIHNSREYISCFPHQ